MSERALDAVATLGAAQRLHDAGVRLSGHVDSRGIALVNIPGEAPLTPVDEVLAVLQARQVQAQLEQLEHEAAKAALEAKAAALLTAPATGNP